jgi:hypothetical protein
MNEKYYDTWQFSQALSLIDTAPEIAKNKLEEYLKKYPKDYSMMAYYSSALVTLNKLSEAQKVLDYLEKNYMCDKGFLRQREKVLSLKRTAVTKTKAPMWYLRRPSA